MDRGGDVQKGQLFHHATWRTDSDRLVVLQLLCDHGLPLSDINKIKYQDFPQEYHLNMYSGIGTPLHNAVRVGNLDTIKWLVDHGADPLVKDPLGQTALELAMDKGKTEIIDYLTRSSRTDKSTQRRHDFVDQPWNKVQSEEEGRETLVQFYRENDPGRLETQDGQVVVRPIEWAPLSL